ncbi:KaiC domain-containing protein [Salarchaeum sp. JOR-1]|uniref:KaiC domain-containing protein n=1 Tax=Salarchaeum sp. JOR-1 TaxID=2599399 RepID=UPI0011989096|nr:KaiC domain-containing protein [Salarchaeum sp. JOR-1]QDX40747.1 KaiC domain-containing protein [Salarchaeum sp. JOR-1]
MADDEDWFERAFSDDEDEADTGEPSESEGDTDPADTEESPEPSRTDEFETAFGGGSEDESEVSDEGADETGAATENEGRFEAAFGAGEPETEAEATADDFEAAFGGGSDDTTADGFEAAFGSGGGGGDGGFGFDLDSGAETDFEDGEFESDIPRVELGIEGLDNMVQGGVPKRSLIVAIGSAGTGKTTFGLQFLNHALKNDERAVFITLEETEERIVDSANERGWSFAEHIANGDLAIIDLDPIEMANSLTSIRNELPRLVEDFGATRLVLDSVSLLEMMYDDQATRRTEIYDFTKALKNAGVTTMLTSEAAENNPYASRHGIIEYLTDAVFLLRYIRPDDFRETRLAVEIQKIRDANHSRETKPYEITGQGISVYRQANIF